MKRGLGLLLVVPLLFAISACAPTRHAGGSPKPHAGSNASSSASSSATPTSAPVVAPPASPPKINPADYLINGTPNVPDADGEWYGEWAFFTDATKSVWCRFDIFSGDAPGGGCYINPAAKASVTYAIPAAASNSCDLSSDNARDGYALGLNDQPLADQLAGWSGCATAYFEPPADLANTRVLPDGATLTVDPFSCSAKASVATCVWNVDSSIATITLGLHSATFSHT